MTTLVSESTKPITGLERESYSARLNSKIGLNESTSEKASMDNYYFYSTGNFHFIMGKGFKPETLENIPLTKVPFLPNWYDGIISIHGGIMPVIDILKFAKMEQLDVSKGDKNKSYLLKLEHKDHRPIVLKLDSLPQLVDTKQLKTIKTNNNSPHWISNYLVDHNKKIAVIDSHKLFEQIINTQ